MNGPSKFRMLAAAIGVMASASPVSNNTCRRKAHHKPKALRLADMTKELTLHDRAHIRDAEEKRERKALKRLNKAFPLTAEILALSDGCLEEFGS